MIPADSPRNSSLETAGLTVRGLILRDSLSFLVLTLSTAALFGVTLFLFRSFQTHREDLAVRWSERGRAAIQQGRPDLAVSALRVALGYKPDEPSYQLLLAEALAESGRIDEATNYFLNLRESRPGDGFINLELARLARKRGNAQEAIDDYRAAIFGDWHGDGLERRRSVRLELADYFAERHDFAAARAELLVAAGNAPDTAELNLLFGDQLLAAGDPHDALVYYEKAVADDPHNAAALEKAGREAYTQGDYAKAHDLLTRALECMPAKPMVWNELDVQRKRENRDELAALARNAQRLPELSLSRELPTKDRADHLQRAEMIARARLNECAAKQSSPRNASISTAAAADPLEDLLIRWKAAAGASRMALTGNATAQDTMAQLIFDTESVTSQVCGAPTGDDALLLMLGRPRTPARKNGEPE
ncbi:tetratricopeptide repeat protein [Edaphobacter bradus]|uniref:tetratricopeptide repeat protein n=1 Tax=Edaphobacter bradus TaxID=2259016 RepID=UPI0021E00DD8|nr:tetratricopeptide repeat protein [Edaphobacter bradus]